MLSIFLLRFVCCFFSTHAVYIGLPRDSKQISRNLYLPYPTRVYDKTLNDVLPGLAADDEVNRRWVYLEHRRQVLPLYPLSVQVADLLNVRLS